MMTTLRRLTLFLALLAIAAACGRLTDDGSGIGDGPGDPTPTTGTADGGGSGSIDHPTGPGELVLRIDTSGGFVPPSFLVTHVPEFSLMGDGRIITSGPQIEIYPGPALPNLLQAFVSEEGIQAILEAAREAGLFGPDAHYDNRCVTDLPTTTFTLAAEGETHTISAYALAFDGIQEDPQCLADPADAEHRAALIELRDLLASLPDWLPEGSLGEEEPYPFQELRIFSAPANPTDDVDDIQPSIQAWPLEEPLSSFGRSADLPPSARCGTVSGSELEKLLPEARKTNERTFWTSEDLNYLLLFRPLLPDESGCPAA